MPEDISISKTLSIRNCGLDEYWLQDQIAANPGNLGLGDLVFVEREKRQVSGGKLDLLLKDRESDSLFEVEVMLGETDGDHISRTIEYWDNERRQDQKRNHFPVLIAEEITRRFFNLIHLHSLTIPIIAIKASIIEVEGKKALHFTTILNAFENSKFEGRRQSESNSRHDSAESYSEEAWVEKSPTTVACAKALLSAVKQPLPNANLKCFKFGLTIYRGNRCYFWFKHKDNGKSQVNFWVDETRCKQAKRLLEQVGLSPSLKDENLQVLVDAKMIEANAELFKHLGTLVDESWRGEKAKNESD